jgi:GMC oxidoreductase
MPMEEEFIKACYDVSKSKNTLHDAWSGDHLGFYSSLGAVDRTGNIGTRSYAATGYLKPNLGRPNLKVLTGALASKVLLEISGQEEPRGMDFPRSKDEFFAYSDPTQRLVPSSSSWTNPTQQKPPVK